MQSHQIRKLRGIKRPAALCGFLAAGFLLAFSAYPAGASEARPGHLLVGFSDQASRSTIEQTLDRADVDSVRNLARIDTRLVRLEEGVTRAEAANSLRRSGAVEFVEPDYRVETSLTPSDTFFGDLWGLNNTGQAIRGFAGQADADIDAPEAWDTETGLAGDVVVGISDTGIDLEHGDLVDNLWSNPGEIPGNGIDDDNNGRIDDVHGWNWVSGNNNPDDDHSHGTHVAGTVAARGNNAKGVTGVSWGAKLAALKVLGADGKGWTSDVAASVLYAGQKGMDVLNASLGGGGYSATFYNALSASANTLYVFAAGNNGQDIDAAKYYPCSYDLPNVICVGATTSTDALASFSNYGVAEVDLAAPGQTILSTYPRSSGGVDQYAWASGTSMATPHVAGAAAVLRQARTSSSVAELKDWILSDGDAIPSLTGKTLTGKRLNLNGSLTQVIAADPAPPPPAPVITSGPTGQTTSTSASFSFIGEAGASFQCQLDPGSFEPCASPRDYSNLATGSRTFRVRQTDQAGNTSSEATRTWTIESTPPPPPPEPDVPEDPPPLAPVITSGSTGLTNSAAASFSFTGEPDATFECQLNSASFESCNSPMVYFDLTQGSHTFRVRQTNQAGNTSSEATRTWTVDTIAPAAPVITSGPTGQTTSTSASFSFTGEAGASFQCQLDSGSFEPCASPRDYSNLATGSRTFRVRQTDQAGNASEEAGLDWTIVLPLLPRPRVESGPAKKTRAATARFTFSGKAGSSYQCRLNSRAWAGCGSPATYRKLKPRRHTFQVRQGDGQRFSQPAAYPWRVVRKK